MEITKLTLIYGMKTMMEIMIGYLLMRMKILSQIYVLISDSHDDYNYDLYYFDDNEDEKTDRIGHDYNNDQYRRIPRRIININRILLDYLE